MNEDIQENQLVTIVLHARAQLDELGRDMSRIIVGIETAQRIGLHATHVDLGDANPEVMFVDGERFAVEGTERVPYCIEIDLNATGGE